MKVLVTGGAGFIGSHLAERLVELGNEVVVIDNLSVSDCNIPILKNLGVSINICDISKFEEIESLFKGVDIVFHLAAMNRAQRSIENPLLANEYNITGTLNVLEAAKRAGVSRFVNISSSSVYTGVRDRLLSEDMPLSPPHPYGVGKLAGEHYARIYYELYHLPFVTLRYFSVYGPRQLGDIDKAGVIAKFIHSAFSNKPLTIYGNGEQKRNFTYVSDVVDLTIKASETKDATGNVFNLANPQEVSVNYLAGLIKKILGKDLKIEYLPPILGDCERNPADISRLKEILGFSPKIDFEEGIRRTIDWYVEKLKI
ncbi:MAG: NAD-dependent epimerase/dehydratase family protein [bacterium]